MCILYSSLCVCASVCVRACVCVLCVYMFCVCRGGCTYVCVLVNLTCFVNLQPNSVPDGTTTENTCRVGKHIY